MILIRNNSKYTFSNEGLNIKLEGTVILNLGGLEVICSAFGSSLQILANITYKYNSGGLTDKKVSNINRNNLSEIELLLEDTIDNLIQRFNFS